MSSFLRVNGVTLAVPVRLVNDSRLWEYYERGFLAAQMPEMTPASGGYKDAYVDHIYGIGFMHGKMATKIEALHW